MKIKILGLIFCTLSIVMLIIWFMSNHYDNDQCLVTDYEYHSYKIRGTVWIENYNTNGYTGSKCPDGDTECYQDFKEKYPIGDTFKCWYSDSADSPLRVYRNDPVLIYYDLYFIFMLIAIGCAFMHAIVTNEWVRRFYRNCCAGIWEFAKSFDECTQCIIFILCLFLFIFGLAGYYPDINTNYVKSSCHVREYVTEIAHSKVYVSARITIENPFYDIRATSQKYCKQSIHGYNDEKFQDCFAKISEKRPVNQTNDCWYDKRTYEPYHIYWNAQNQPVENYDETMIAVAAVVVFLCGCCLYGNRDYPFGYIDPVATPLLTDIENPSINVTETTYNGAYGSSWSNGPPGPSGSNGPPGLSGSNGPPGPSGIYPEFTESGQSRNIDVTISTGASINAIEEGKPSAPPPNYDFTCGICSENYKDLIFKPCQHQYMCSSCDRSKITECPICRAKITETQRVYWA